ncbi:MAG: DNA-binding protein [Clostridia bacterium]|nr:DNA-binding protein [Clostridia bacterium]
MDTKSIVTKNLLLDFYGKLLTDKQREMYTLKYEDDLSITEIAEEFGISKQGVSDSINKTEKALNDYENKLHLVERYEALNEVIDELDTKLSDKEAKELKQVRSKLEKIRNI